MYKILLAILCCFFAVGSLCAQTDSLVLRPNQFTAEDIMPRAANNTETVVSASRTSRNISDLPVTVHVVTGDEIRKNGYVSLADVLKNVPGIKVSQPGSGPDGDLFLMRGSIGNTYAKILINSIPITPSVNGSMPLGEQLPIQQAERIEIIYGTASAVYGSDAMAGVVNIILPVTDRSSFARAELSGGGFGYRRFTFSAGGKAGKNENILRYNVYGSSSHREDQPVKYNNGIYAPFAGIDLPSGVEPSLDIIRNMFNIGYYRGTVEQAQMSRMPHESRLLGAQLDFRRWRFTYQYSYRRDFSNLGQDALFWGYHDPSSMFGEDIQRLTVSNEYTSGRWTHLTNLSYVRYRMDESSNFMTNFWRPGNGRAYVYSASDDAFIEKLFTYRPDNTKWEIVSGGSFQYSANLPRTNYLRDPFDRDDYRAFTQPDFRPDTETGMFGFNFFTFYNIGVFAQATYTSKRWTTIFGARADYNSRYNTGLAYPRIAVLYKFNERTSLRTAAGIGFRAPSGYQAFASIASPTDQNTISYNLIPNPDLRPEALSSVEIGLRRRWSEKVNMDLTAFTHGTLGVITLEGVPSSSLVGQYPRIEPNEVTRRFSNSYDVFATIIGLQANLRVSNLWAPLRLGIDSYISFTDGLERLPNGQNIQDIRSVPGVFGQLRLYCTPFKKAYIAVEQVYSGRTLRRFSDNQNIYADRYAYIPAYYTIDLHARYELSKQLSAFTRLNNATNAHYGGIDALGADVDMVYNPQRLRTLYMGLTFRFE